MPTQQSSHADHAGDPASDPFHQWINRPSSIRYLQRDPDERDVGAVDHVVRTAMSVRNTSDTTWALSGEMGVLLREILEKDKTPDLTMVLLPGQDGGIVISVILSVGGKGVIAESSSYQLLVDLLVGGPPSNLPADALVTVALPAGTVVAPVKWAGNRQGLLEINGDPIKPWRIIWGDRVDEAHMIGAASTS